MTDTPRHFVPSFVQSFIQEFISRPFKKLTQRPPAYPCRNKLVEQLAEHICITFTQEADLQRDPVPGGGANNGKCATLSSCSNSTRYQELARNTRAEGSTARYTRYGLQSSQRYPEGLSGRVPHALISALEFMLGISQPLSSSFIEP